ncbi:MAG: MDR family MFS transporter [Armatimonadota bacterium]|nr:MDR family MFS transporter [Armatimonadota bacterium]
MKIVVTRPELDTMTGRDRWLVTYAVMLGMFLAALDTTIVATALPTIARTLDGIELYPWVVAAYSLTMTAGTPVFGRLSDRYGRRRVYLFGIAAFLAGSALCGAARTMPQLVVFRAIQGIGAGALLPIAITIIGDIYTVEERARIQGLFSGVWGVASIVGPVLGGVIVNFWSWPWIFYVNLPIGAVALWVVWRGYPERPAAAEGDVDVPGAVLLVASVVLLLVSLERGSVHWAGVGASVLLGAVFVYRETRVAHPILPLELFRNRVVAVTSISGLLIGAALFGSLYYIPLFVQGVRGGAATDAGFALMPLMLSWTVASTIGGRLILRIGFRAIASVGLALLAGGFVLLTRMNPQMSVAAVQFATALLGTGMGLAILVFVLAVQTSVPYAQRGLATSLTLFFRTIGGAIGVSLLGSLLLARLAADGFPARAVQTVLDPVRRAALPGATLSAMQDSLASALGTLFAVSLVLVLLALVSLRWLPAGRAVDLRASVAPEAAE